MRVKSMRFFVAVELMTLLMALAPARADSLNFESSQVHPIRLTPSASRLLAVNTPDALLEVFAVGPTGSLTRLAPIPVGLEPVSVTARTDTEIWVVNHLSDSISIVDLGLGTVIRTLRVGDEPTDVVFAQGKAFVAVSQEDSVKVFNLLDLAQPPVKIDIFSSDMRALAVANNGSKVYAVALHSGNQTTVVNANVIRANTSGLDATRLAALGLNNITCSAAPPPYPPHPAGIARDPSLTDPANGAQPPVSLIVKWDQATGKWRDEIGQDWSPCLPYRLADHDLFVIDANTPGDPNTLRTVDHLGTTLFEVSVNPVTGKIYVPNTDARNFVRFEHPLGVQGHMVDNQLSIVDPAAGNSVSRLDLNTHIDRASNPSTNLQEREASISQPGMMVWNMAGSRAYLTAIGSRKLWRVDGSCASGSCVFGPNRSTPDAVEVGEGPTGVALDESAGRAFVLNRFSNTIATVDVSGSAMLKISEIPLHDPSPAVVRDGRHLLYDGVSGSGHGDAACSSCHISGDRDELSWDLGNPQGTFATYGSAGDNVRFIIPVGGQPVTCAPGQCAAHAGFDPEKGPMATQSLRGMLEPLHWRGDRGTMNAFNKAFVGLMGTADVGPINGEPAGLPADQMELFRQFALGIVYPPNPFRNLDDTLPNTAVNVPGNPNPGNPAAGQALFFTGRTDANQPCSACHAAPFGAAGGKLGGVNPSDPNTFAALFNGNADGSPHSDLKVPHLRNMYEKFGPRFGVATDPNNLPEAKTGFGFIHDGAIPDLNTFLSSQVFTLTPQQVKDISMFLLHFPTGIKPAVGSSLTVPAGPAGPPGTPPEQLLATLIGLGNAADPNRHCELTASAAMSGRERSWFLDGGMSSGGVWTTDIDGETQVSTATLRGTVAGPLSFMCAPIGSGARLGADRDLDGHFNGSDCSDGEPGFYLGPAEASNVAVDATAPTMLSWDDQSAQVGATLFYEVVGGSLRALRIAGGLGGPTSCLAGDLRTPSWDDMRGDPAPGEGYYYLVRARNPECSGGFGPGTSAIEPLDCTGF
jgi:YVTN family beta-propeller protein